MRITITRKMPRPPIRILAWSSIVVLFIVTETALRPHTIISPPVDRFIALVCVGALFSLAYPRHSLVVVGLLLVTVVGFELLQRLVPGRHGYETDMIVKGAGACVGVLVGYCLDQVSGLSTKSEEP